MSRTHLCRPSPFFSLMIMIGDLLWLIFSLRTMTGNDFTTGRQNLNWLSHPNVILAPQAMQARANGENLNYSTLAPQARPSGESFNYSLSHYSDILKYDQCAEGTNDLIY